jgi:hypothetical protein
MKCEDLTGMDRVSLPLNLGTDAVSSTLPAGTCSVLLAGGVDAAGRRRARARRTHRDRRGDDRDARIAIRCTAPWVYR